MHSRRLLGALMLPLALGARPAAAIPPQVAAADTTGGVAEDPLPLTPARTLARTLDEGSWISVDVSPDGQTLVFDLLGDLYTLPLAGGAATPLTQGMAFDAQPRFSPDGQRVVFTSDRDGAQNLWIIALDRSDTVQVTHAEGDEGFQSPEWTPDGSGIVATSDAGPGPGKLWLYHVEGGTGVQLVREPEELRTTGAAFGDDDRYVWFAQRRGTWTYNSAMGEYQLAVYDRETGEVAEQSSRYGGAFRPTLSPDGRWLAYGTRHVAETGLRLRDLETGDERWLAHPVQRDDQESRATRDVYPGMSFTPDSRELVVSYGGKLWRVPVDGGEAREVPFRADVRLGIGPEVDFEYPIEDTPTFTARQIRDAVPSPDGTRLAFTVLDRLYVMDFPGGEPQRVTDQALNEHQPTWSPDGRWLAFATWDPAEGGQLYRARADGRGEAERLTRMSALYQQPAWSPDGERIVALRGPARAYEEALARGTPGGATELVWIGAEGGEATRIVPVGDLQHPHFTRDPERIYAFSEEDGLVSFRWDGTDRRGHLKVTGARLPGAEDPIEASLVLMAPGGDQALAQVVSDLYVVTVPRVGGETPTISVADPDEAAFPARKLTEVGGQFPVWGTQGQRVHWSVGNAHLVYDLAAARAAEAESGSEYRPREARIAVQVARDLPEGVAVLRGARAVTMRGDEVIEDADILIRGNRITAVGRRGTVEVPAGAEVIDLAGETVVPGFVDTHAHLRGSAGIHRPQPWSYAANLAYGVTTTRDPQTGTTDALTYEDLVRAGRILGPRAYSTGPGVFASEQIRSLEHARDVLRRYSEYYDTKTIKMYGAGNRQQRQWIVMAARELRLMPTTEGSLDLQENLTMAIDGYSGIEHNLPGFPLYDDVVQLFATSGTVTTPTILVTYGGPWAENYFYATEDVLGDRKLRYFTPFEEVQSKALRRPGPGPGPSGWFHPAVHTFDRVAEFVADVVEAGGRAGVGSHGQLQGLGYHWELWAMQSGGLSEHDALRVATLMGADALGLEGDLGSIEPGKLADLVVLERDPLEDIRNSNSVRLVMRNGRLYDAGTLDEVWPRQRRAGPFPWQEEAMPQAAAGIR